MIEPVAMNKAQQRVFGFLTSYVGNIMSMKSLRIFLRFVTGSSVVIGKNISVEFNCLSGLARRPIAHMWLHCGAAYHIRYFC
jgi:hypothetical protein